MQKIIQQTVFKQVIKKKEQTVAPKGDENVKKKIQKL